MRTIAAIAALALVAACSSSGPVRPIPPGGTTAAPLVIRWTTPTENTDGSPLTDIARFDIVVTAGGQVLTQRSESPDTAQVVVPVPFGPWTVRVTAVSATSGAGETAEASGTR